MHLPIKLRPVASTDVDFLISSWTKSYRQSYFAQKIPNEIYFTEHKKIIARRFQDSSALIAYHDRDEDQICGYIVYAPAKHRTACLLVHYVYVKHPFRRLGVGKALLSEAIADASHAPGTPIVVSHITSNFTKFCPEEVAYNPYIIS